jgi:hypothetical protein
VSDQLGLGLTLDHADDDYDHSRVGLQSSRSSGVGADLSYALSERTQFQLFAQGERVRSRQAGSQTFTAPDWSAAGKDRFELFGIGIKHAAIADKLELGADLAFSRAKSDLSVDTGIGTPAFPSAKTTRDSLKLYARYKLNDQLWLDGSWWHERYEAQDWRLDGVLPATLPELLALGLQAPRYRVNVLRLALRYRF